MSNVRQPTYDEFYKKAEASKSKRTGTGFVHASFYYRKAVEIARQQLEKDSVNREIQQKIEDAEVALYHLLDFPYSRQYLAVKYHAGIVFRESKNRYRDIAIGLDFLGAPIQQFNPQNTLRRLARNNPYEFATLLEDCQDDRISTALDKFVPDSIYREDILQSLNQYAAEKYGLVATSPKEVIQCRVQSEKEDHSVPLESKMPNADMVTTIKKILPEAYAGMKQFDGSNVPDRIEDALNDGLFRVLKRQDAKIAKGDARHTKEVLATLEKIHSDWNEQKDAGLKQCFDDEYEILGHLKTVYLKFLKDYLEKHRNPGSPEDKEIMEKASKSALLDHRRIYFTSLACFTFFRRSRTSSRDTADTLIANALKADEKRSAQLKMA